MPKSYDHLKYKRFKQLISNDDIKVISFDVFDTLLIRPAIAPKAILQLVCWKLEKIIKRNLFFDRINAESVLKDPFCTIEKIWDYIGNRNDLTDADIEICIKTEIEIEKKLLYPRKIGRDLYDLAIKSGKKIIVVSDMYLSDTIIRNILETNGFNEISNQYVSCICKNRKSTGALYKYVLDKECIKPYNFLHIGDNYISDYKIPKSLGAKAIHVPSNLELFKKLYHGKRIESLLNKLNNYESIIWGACINEIMECSTQVDALSLISYVVVAPTLLHTGLYILNNSDIQDNYKRIYFASRDGYLPLKIYEILSSHSAKKKIQSHYFAASRRAYAPYTEDSIYNCLSNERMSQDYLLSDFIQQNMWNMALKNKLLEAIQPDNLGIHIKNKLDVVKNILAPFSDEIKEDTENKKKLCRQYYENIFADDKNPLVFDCGYSGSISRSLNNVFEGKKIFDKIYLWETEKNREIDRIDKSKTHVVIGGDRPKWFDVLLEDCFSPLQGSTVGFAYENHRVNPVYESIAFSKEMSDDLNRIHQISMELADKFGNLFGKELDFLKVDAFQSVSEISFYFLTKQGDNASKAFHNIVFPDTYLRHGSDTISLEKIINDINYRFYANPLIRKAYRFINKRRQMK